MADEKPGAAAPDAAEAAYKAELAERVKYDVESMGISTEEKKPEEPEKKDGDEEPEKKEEGDDAGEKEDEGEDDTADGDEKKPVDEKYSKALRRIQKQEAELQHFKNQIIAADRQLRDREHKVQTQEAELGQFIRQLQIDPYNTLLNAGLLKDDDAEYWSKQLYYNSKAAAADPKSKAEAERLRRERQMAWEANKTRLEVEQLRKERDEERAQMAAQRHEDQYVARLDATIEAYKAKTPLLATALKQNLTRTREELYRVARDLSIAKGEYADPGLVMLAWTKERKALLADLGIKDVAKQEQVESKKAAEKKGPPDGKQSNGQAQTDETDPAEAAFKKELRERLAGTYVGD